MARRRSARQDPDAVDVEQIRAMQAAEGQLTPARSGSATSGKAKKASKKQPKESEAKEPISRGE